MVLINLGLDIDSQEVIDMFEDLKSLIRIANKSVPPLANYGIGGELRTKVNQLKRKYNVD